MAGKAELAEEAVPALSRAGREAEAEVASMRPNCSKPNRTEWQTRHCPTMHNG